MSATTLPSENAAPEVIHSCPNCSHWLPDGTLACPDCQTLTYGQYLGLLANGAQQLEQQQQWKQAREQWQSALQWLPGDTQQAAGIQQHIAQIDARIQADEDTKARWTKRLGPFAPIALFLIKIKSFLFLAFKLKFLIGFLAFFGLYWALFGIPFAAGFMVILFLHEMGHYVAVKRRGLQADLPMFLPGLGAYVRWYGQGVSREDLGSIALAGPLFGLFAAMACWGIFAYTHRGPVLAAQGRYGPIFLVLANVGAWINFINLFPFLGLDGSHASFALSRMQRGLVAATCLLFFALTITGGDLFGPTTQWIFAIVGLGMAWRTFANDVPEQPSTRTFLTFQALVIALGLIVFETGLLLARMQLAAGR
jgi:Zn-dependent protease